MYVGKTLNKTIIFLKYSNFLSKNMAILIYVLGT